MRGNKEGNANRQVEREREREEEYEERRGRERERGGMQSDGEKSKLEEKRGREGGRVYQKKDLFSVPPSGLCIVGVLYV